MRKAVALTLAVAVGVLPAVSAEFDDPSWPCIQPKVEDLSLGLMWPNPVDPATLPADAAPAADALVEALALRRTDLDAAKALIDDFVAETPGADRAMIGQVFAELFERVSRERRRVVTGIGNYSRKQIALAARIEAARGEMDAAMAAATPNYDQVDALETQLAWDERIYRDRQQSLTYVCETPVLIEKRLYAIAQMMLAATQ
jgi:hypothetical protein